MWNKVQAGIVTEKSMKSRDEEPGAIVSPHFEEVRKVILAAGRSCVLCPLIDESVQFAFFYLCNHQLGEV